MTMIPGGGGEYNEEELASRDYSLLTPESGVRMQIIRSEGKDKNGDGQNFAVSAFIECIDGNQAGRKFWMNWYLISNGKENKGFRADFNLLSKAMDRPKPFVSVDEMLNIPFIGDVAVEPAKDGFAAKNIMRNPKKFDAFAKTETKPAASGGASWRRI